MATPTETAARTVAAMASRYGRRYKLSAAPYGGRVEHGGTIYAEPYAFLYKTATALTSDGSNGSEEFDGAPTLEAGDRIFVKHYGWHTVEIDDEGPFPSHNAHLSRDRDGFTSLP